MELKYYLRGLGLGIIVTAIIMGVAASRKQTMTDEEIIARAKQLGMIEDTVLTQSVLREENDSDEDASDINGSGESPSEDDFGTDISETETGEQELETTGAAFNEVPETDEIVQNRQPDITMEPEEDENREENEEQPTAETSEDNDHETAGLSASVVVTIGSGDGSYSVSRKLAGLGAVESAEDFDTFLCANGYDKRIITGSHTIPADADDEQIARIITGAE